MTCPQHPQKQLNKTAYKGMLGISLVEISLSLALTGLTTAWAARNIIREHAKVIAQAEALSLGELQKSMQTYLDEFALTLVDGASSGISRTIDSGGTREQYGATVVSLASGQQEGESFWPTLQQLQTLRLLPETFEARSNLSPSRSYKTGRIQVLPLGGEAGLTADPASCLRDGCILRWMAFLEDTSASNENEDWNRFLKSPQTTGFLLQTPGLNTLIAHSTDGQLYDAKGKSLGYTSSKVSVNGDIGVYAEVRIPSLQQRKLTDSMTCPAGYFGFSGAERTTSSATEFADSKPSRCVAAHGSIPVNQQVVAYDLNAPYTGHVRLVCELVGGTSSLEVRAAIDASDPMGPTDFSCKP